MEQRFQQHGGTCEGLWKGAWTVKPGGYERSLWLNEEEALGLLDIVMLCPGDLTPSQRAAVVKLSEYCRQFLRTQEEEPVVLGEAWPQAACAA